ncbi:hypothetical protein FBY40_1873 [Microbacterium sp. SLBN-154]|uniref:hypothetical protein n=1 Tax=Microbacterium sp. SLBN-154 TaxID=2768458 RepID=UPI001153F387|nr:hypothetical protein [Microbacterium sp. SLBN-154]TQK19375.1 hypothetical protein FBY40_1873 [Microbacterium sp. SLBN-154]
MSTDRVREVRVRAGRVQPSGSWIYVWIDVVTNAVAYVGGTGFDPELRAYLHVTSDDPDIGRVRAAIPRYEERNFDVLAFAVPGHIDRAEARSALAADVTCGGQPAASSSREVAEFVGRILSELDARGVKRMLGDAARPEHGSPR